jgi:hypothetical protein
MVAFRYIGATKPTGRWIRVYLPDYLRHVRLMYERVLTHRKLLMPYQVRKPGMVGDCEFEILPLLPGKGIHYQFPARELDIEQMFLQNQNFVLQIT